MSVDWNQSLQHAAVTDVGMRRSNNQDSYAVVLAGDVENWFSRGHLFIVADGMGAHAAGELASKLAVDNISHLYHKHHELSPPEALQKAIIETNAEIHRKGQANAEFHNMGTTSSVLVLLPHGALVAHVGDSRIYRLRGDTFRQLTFDHSLVWEMKHSGQVPEGVDVNTLAPKNVITRSLGPNEKVKVDFEGPYPVAQGDVFLMCSDGLTGRVEDHEIALILATLPAKEAARRSSIWRTCAAVPTISRSSSCGLSIPTSRPRTCSLSRWCSGPSRKTNEMCTWRFGSSPAFAYSPPW